MDFLVHLVLNFHTMGELLGWVDLIGLSTFFCHGQKGDYLSRVSQRARGATKNTFRLAARVCLLSARSISRYSSSFSSSGWLHVRPLAGVCFSYQSDTAQCRLQQLCALLNYLFLISACKRTTWRHYASLTFHSSLLPFRGEGVQIIVIDMSVCLSVHFHISEHNAEL